MSYRSDIVERCITEAFFIFCCGVIGIVLFFGAVWTPTGFHYGELLWYIPGGFFAFVFCCIMWDED